MCEATVLKLSEAHETQTSSHKCEVLSVRVMSALMLYVNLELLAIQNLNHIRSIIVAWSDGEQWRFGNACIEHHLLISNQNIARKRSRESD